MSFTKVDGGVCAAKGYVANGLNCGLNKDANKNDLALVYSETECQAAAVYTTNKVKGAPIQVTKAHLEKSGHKAKAVIATASIAPRININPRISWITNLVLKHSQVRSALVIGSTVTNKLALTLPNIPIPMPYSTNGNKEPTIATPTDNIQI